MNFGSAGGSIKYVAGNSYNRDQFSFSFSVGGLISIGLRGYVSDNNTIYSINVEPNAGSVQLYVNETKKVERYRKDRYLPNRKIIFEGYYHTPPQTTHASLN